MAIAKRLLYSVRRITNSEIEAHLIGVDMFARAILSSDQNIP